MGNDPGRHPQILIVEDDSLIRELMKRIVEIEDHWQPTVVKSGANAVEAWENGDFDVILMDLRMPEIDGIEATKRIREHEKRSGRKRTPIIAFTVMVGEEYRQKCDEAGMDDFIEKPGNIKNVVGTIYKHLPL
ncbi:response regulator [Desulfuromonas sp. TF]|uniref:response regulator n=1 Tax=Desulfuromonas sp. TF TaxID=1232410 RepID=UPI0004203B6B|nr:response regulator [Desulfuromonas sp. TF]